MEQWPGFKPLREPKPNESGLDPGSVAGVLELGQYGERTVAGAGLRASNRCSFLCVAGNGLILDIPARTGLSGSSSASLVATYS